MCCETTTFQSKDSESSNWNNQKNGWWTLGKNLKTRAFDCSFCRRSQVLRWVGCCMVLETRQLLKLVSLGAFIRSFYQKYDHFPWWLASREGESETPKFYLDCVSWNQSCLEVLCFKHIFTKSIREKFTGWSFFAESEVGYCALAMRHKCSGICPVKHVNAWNICSSTISIFVFAYQGISLSVHSSVHHFPGHTKYVGVHHIDWFHAAKWYFFGSCTCTWLFSILGDNFSNQISLMWKCVKPSNACLEHLLWTSTTSKVLLFWTRWTHLLVRCCMHALLQT